MVIGTATRLNRVGSHLPDSWFIGSLDDLSSRLRPLAVLPVFRGGNLLRALHDYHLHVGRFAVDQVYVDVVLGE